jgi:general secretion pathway protein F
VAVFEYIALNTSGRRVAGSLAGVSEQAVLTELEARQLTPVSIAPKGDARSFGRGFSSRKLGESYEQLADLLHAGVPLLRGLKLLSSRKAQPRLATVYRGLAEAVEKGADLGAAMSELPSIFPPVHTAMVRAGERGGFLEQVLARLGRLVVRQAELRSKVIGNLIYPAVLLVLGLGVGGIIFGYFVPMFRPMFEGIQSGLPLATRIVFAASDAVSTYWTYTIASLAALAAVLWWASRRADVRDWIERAKLRLPLAGGLIRGFATARFCQLLGTMLSNGVPMLAALAITKDGTGSPLLGRAVEKAAESVKAGQPLAAPLAESGMLEDDIVEMIAVGETANNLDEVLLKIGDGIEARLDRLLNNAVRLIEPLLLLLIAGVVGLVAAGLLLPLSKLSSSM